MIEMPATVVADSKSDVCRKRFQSSQKFQERLLLKSHMFLQSSVQLCYVAGVVFAVMNLHRLGIDAGFKSVCRIGQWWKFVSHGFFRLSSRET
jgi:hypothetical protein